MTLRLSAMQLRSAAVMSLLAAALANPGHAQYPILGGGPPIGERGFEVSGGNFLSGEIACGGCVGLDNLQIELSNQGIGRGRRVDVSSTGQFEIRGVPPGSYFLRVLNQFGDVLHQELVNVPSGPLFVRLGGMEKRERPITGTVSLARLQHKVPSKAQKEFRKAADASEKGDMEKSIEHLKKAIEIDPDYMEAHNNLGVRYLQKNDYEKALVEFETALRLDSGSALATVNAAVALYSLGRLPEAVVSARRAVDLDASSTKARYILGLALVAQRIYSDEALHNLQTAATEIPKARLFVAEIMERRGQRAEARAQLEEYLAKDNAANRAEVEKRIERLK